ncbi:MAG: MBL fold metallo-hydrolase [Desulfobacteraceae bacterium]|nr:MAG: MBL fold metallo-hydrolase [Desulfobacteraceae bacterium]
MLIKCWGSRGSIPVSGKNYIKYGGDTTCMEIRTRSNDIIIIDAGTGIRRLGNQLIEEKKYHYNIIFTHAHWDHLIGFPFFKPLFIKETEIDIYRCPFPKQYAEKMITKLLEPPNFPKKYNELNATIRYIDGCPNQFEIGSVTVIPIRLSHPNGGCGYKFIEDGKTFVFLTDNELGFVHSGGLERSAYLEFSVNADLLIHDAEYTPLEYKKQIEWGHSTYIDALDLAHEAGVKKLGLFHINQERTDSEMDQIEKDCQQISKDQGYNMDCFAVAWDMIFEV